jgi:glycosyltransferase involved in cell wall biosynthesis
MDQSTENPKVVFFQRKPLSSGNYSIEFLFSDLRTRLKPWIDVHVRQSRFESQGILKRLFNVIEAALWQGEVNLITGDIQYVATLMRKDRTILVVLDCGFIHQSKGIRRLVQEWLWYRIPAARASTVVTISEFTKQELVDYLHIPADRVLVIPVWISTAFQAFPRKFNTDKPALLQVGQAENKNLARIVDAIRGLSVRLFIVGQLSANMRDRLNHAAIHYVEYTNLSTEELVRVYQESDMLVFPSTYEGFGMPILEAQAIGRPVVTSNTSSMPWVAGDAACFVDPFSPDSIREGVLRVINDQRFRDELVVRGFANVRRFDPDAIACSYRQAIETLLNRSVG